LILHDDAALGSSIAAAMVGCGFEHIDSSGAASTVIPDAAGTKPDVIVLDIDLAGSRGVGIISELLEASPESVIVVLSEFEGPRFQTLQAGAHAFLQKSDLRELRRCVDGLSLSGPRPKPPEAGAPATRCDESGHGALST
jgi:DNA-binding NarL/FixJ family response regulator